MEKEFLTDEDRASIREAVTNAESTTAGEIVVVVVKDSASFNGINPVYSHAVQAFYKHGLKNTKDKTGVLIFLSLQEKQIQILADEGINQKVTQKVWDDMVTQLAENIMSGNACSGLCEIVSKVGEILTLKFPINADDHNELSNDVVMEE